MPSYSLTDAAGNHLSDIRPDGLLQMLQESTDFVVLRRDDWPDRSATATRLDQGWQIELADGGRKQVARVPVTDAALDTLRSWAEEDDWWQEAFSWRTVTQ